MPGTPGLTDILSLHPYSLMWAFVYLLLQMETEVRRRLATCPVSQPVEEPGCGNMPA